MMLSGWIDGRGGVIRFEWLTIRTASAVIGTNESFRENALRRGADPKKVIVVRNGPRHAETEDEKAARAIRGIRRRELFRIASGDLLGLTDVADVGAGLSRLTDATLEATHTPMLPTRSETTDPVVVGGCPPQRQLRLQLEAGARFTHSSFTLDDNAFTVSSTAIGRTYTATAWVKAGSTASEPASRANPRPTVLAVTLSVRLLP